MMVPYRDSDWLAGFADGEACFTISRAHLGWAPRFSIKLRSDDLTVLEELCAAFGGAIAIHAYGTQNPMANWHIAAKRDLAGVVTYFDAHPLRAKKARDYAIWRRAVLAYCSYGQRAPGLEALRDALIAGRRFDTDDTARDLLQVPDSQLRLVS